MGIKVKNLGISV